MRTYLLYLLLPVAVAALLVIFGGPLTYGLGSTISTAAFISSFMGTLVLGLIAVHRHYHLFIKEGNFAIFNAALGFLVLAFFSAAAGLSFISEFFVPIVGWLIQIGTLLAALWFFCSSFIKNEKIEALETRGEIAFMYMVIALVVSAAITWLIYIFQPALPLVYDPAIGWGRELLLSRAAAAVLFLIVGMRLAARGYNVIAGTLFLLAVGSAGVSVVYALDILGTHPLIWLNRALTLLAAWLFLRRAHA